MEIYLHRIKRKIVARIKNEHLRLMERACGFGGGFDPCLQGVAVYSWWDQTTGGTRFIQQGDEIQTTDGGQRSYNRRARIRQQGKEDKKLRGTGIIQEGDENQPTWGRGLWGTKISTRNQQGSLNLGTEFI